MYTIKSLKLDHPKQKNTKREEKDFLFDSDDLNDNQLFCSIICSSHLVFLLFCRLITLGIW